jgi:hydrophobic/amphiphilic exporter-1 (mainly G- bacteria), HAE1 family
LPAVGLANLRGERPILLRDVAEVELGTAEASSISRTNGRPSLNVVVLKEPDANTVEVTAQVLEAVEQIEGLPPDIEVLVLQNDGPEVERELSSLLQEGLLGFLFAISVVFIFLINTRPTLLRGLAITIRPTLIIGISIPLSIMTGILIMGLANLSLNFMSLAGLAIAIGRVVDDSIVVLENMYRHMQRGEKSFRLPFRGLARSAQPSFPLL